MFKKKPLPKQLPTEPKVYPTGVCVKTEFGHWYINGKYRHLLLSPRVVASWRFPFIIESSEAALSKYPKAKYLGFRDGTLVKDQIDGKMYLISGKARRLITTPDTFELLGLTRDDAIWAAHDEIYSHPEGEVL